MYLGSCLHWVENTLHTSRFQTLIGDVWVEAVLPRLYEWAMCYLSLRWKGRISHTKSDFSSQVNTLEWLSSHLNCLQQSFAQREWGSTCAYEPYFLEMSRWKIGKCCFPECRGMGAAALSWGWLTCWTRMLPNAWGLSLLNWQFLPWLCELAMCCLSLISKRHISHAPSVFSTKENTFGVPFEWLKKHAM